MGHATNYIDVDGVGIITDPVFEDAYSPWHSRKIDVPPPETYDQTDIILISHAHRDHLHPKTLARFPKETVILCPEPSAKHVDDLGMTVRIMAPGDEYDFPGGTIIAVVAHHPGGRNALKARADGQALGYVVRTPEQTIYYSGDTDYFEGFYDVGRIHKPDIAILNINSHLNSYDVLLAIGALRYPTVMLSHYGAYNGTNSRRSPGWHAELEQLIGEELVSLEVGNHLLLAGDDAGRLAENKTGSVRNHSKSDANLD
jgi:L-ascorbate metabolism protein UlaG (beta-lactamase superfamily)